MAVTAQVKSLTCPNCGGGVEVRGYARTLNVVCINCLTILDASTPELVILQKFEAQERTQPLLPLGYRGKVRGEDFEVIGFQVRRIVVDEQPYEWHEYLLVNPFKGFRYVTQYDGHWNYIQTISAVPENTSVGGRPAKRYEGEIYRHFQTAFASTVFVMGEFPWQVRVGESVQVQDYIAPPKMLSLELTEGEANWSLGEYVEGREVYQWFQIKEPPPRPEGVYANQPAPKTSNAGSRWKTWMLLNVILFGMMMAFFMTARQEKVFDRSYSFSPLTKGEASFVTEPFELKGRTSNVEVSLKTDLANNSAFFNMALINQDTGQAYDFGREVSYYSGSDSDGSWSEGKASDAVTIPSVPSGKYYMRVEPEMEASSAGGHGVNYAIQVRRDVPVNLFFWLAAIVLLIPPVLGSFRGSGFERRRWQESDYAGGS